MSHDHEKSSRQAKIFCGTWNMGNAQGENMKHFIPEDGNDYDIIAIGLQESTYKIGDESKEGSSTSEGCIKHLSQELETILGKNFFIVEHARRAQMQLYIFARVTLKKHITNIEKSAENTGFLHIFPNKVANSNSLL
jgi:hypothetical protein